MNRNVRKSFVLVAVVTAVMLAFLVFAAATSAKVPVEGNAPKGTLCPPPADGSKQT